MSKKSFDKLNKKQQRVMVKAGKDAEKFFSKASRGLDAKLVKTFKAHHVKVVELTRKEYDAWIRVAKESSYAQFAKEVPNGQTLIDEALSVK